MHLLKGLPSISPDWIGFMFIASKPSFTAICVINTVLSTVQPVREAHIKTKHKNTTNIMNRHKQIM